MNANIRRRCLVCRKWFFPHPAVKNKNHYRQKTCSRKHCQRERHRLGCLEWRKKSPGAKERNQNKARAWAKKRNYWSWYRKRHPDYRKRDNARRRRLYRKLRSSAKRDELSKIAVDKLKSIEAFRPGVSAKRDEFDPRIDSLLGFLFWKEGAAKQDELDLAGASDG